MLLPSAFCNGWISASSEHVSTAKVADPSSCWQAVYSLDIGLRMVTCIATIGVRGYYLVVNAEYADFLLHHSTCCPYFKFSRESFEVGHSNYSIVH